jgi:hypothetical protein
MEEKIGFGEAIKNMFVGVAKPEAYIKNGRAAKLGPAVIVTIIMSVVLYLCVFLIPSNIKYGNGKLSGMIDEHIPEFSLTSEGLYFSKDVEWAEKSTGQYLRLDTDKSSVDAEEVKDLAVKEGYVQIIIIAAKDMAVYQGGQLETIEWNEVFYMLNVTGERTAYGKQDILELIDKWVTPVIVSVYGIKVVSSIISMFLGALIIGLIAMAIGSGMKIKVPFGRMYKSAMYARIIWYTIVIILETIISASLLSVIFDLAIIAIPTVYLVVGLKRDAAQTPASEGSYNQPNNAQNYGDYNQQSYGGYSQPNNQQNYGDYNQPNNAQNYGGYNQPNNQQSYGGYNQPNNAQNYGGYNQPNNQQSYGGYYSKDSGDVDNQSNQLNVSGNGNDDTKSIENSDNNN